MGSYRFIGVSVVARGVTGAASHAKRRHVATMIAATHLALPSIFFFFSICVVVKGQTDTDHPILSGSTSSASYLPLRLRLAPCLHG
jgi:hypothetical protein